MEKTFRLHSGHAFLGGRRVAHEVRTAAEALLTRNPKVVVIIDFAGVEGVSHSVADELLSPLSERLGRDHPRRVRFVNVAAEVLEDLQIAADMHRLEFPTVVSASTMPAA